VTLLPQIISVADLQWPPRPGVNTSSTDHLWTSSVESSSDPWSPVRSHESCRIKSLDASYFIFFSQTPVIRRDGRNECREAYSFSEGPRSNLQRLAFWTPEPRLTLMMMFITTKTVAPLTTVIMILLLLGLLF